MFSMIFSRDLQEHWFSQTLQWKLWMLLCSVYPAGQFGSQALLTHTSRPPERFKRLCLEICLRMKMWNVVVNLTSGENVRRITLYDSRQMRSQMTWLNVPMVRSERQSSGIVIFTSFVNMLRMPVNDWDSFPPQKLHEFIFWKWHPNYFRKWNTRNMKVQIGIDLPPSTWSPFFSTL